MLQEICEQLIKTKMAKTFTAFMESKRFIIMFIRAELNPVYITRHFLSFILKITSTSAYAPQLDDNMKVKVRFTLEQATKAQSGSRDIALLSLTSVLKRGRWSTPRPGCFAPGKDLVPTV
jgi:hypothetical protein